MLGARFARMSEVNPNPMLLQNVRAAVELTGADGAPAAALREVASVALEGEPAFVDPHLLNLAREGLAGGAAAAGGRRRPDGGSGDRLLPPGASDAAPPLAALAPRRRARRRRRGRRRRVRRRFVAGAHARARGAGVASAAPEGGWSEVAANYTRAADAAAGVPQEMVEEAAAAARAAAAAADAAAAELRAVCAAAARG